MTKKDSEFLNDIYQMRSAQKDYESSSKDFNAKQKARMYERKVDAELAIRMNTNTNP